MTELEQRGVQDILIACVDGLSGFGEAIHATFPQTLVQRCVIHQIRHSLRYVTWSDQKEFMGDLKHVYQAPTREAGETHLLELAEKWGERYPAAIRSWENHWAELSPFFDYPAEIRRLIYTTNTIEGYNRQLRKVIKTKSLFPTDKSVRKLLFLVHQNIAKKWTLPIANWPFASRVASRSSPRQRQRWRWGSGDNCQTAAVDAQSPSSAATKRHARPILVVRLARTHSRFYSLVVLFVISFTHSI